MSKEEIDRLQTLMSMEYCYEDTYTQIKELFNSEEFQLKVAQVEALAPISYFRRGFFSCGVGHGKTLISLLAPLVARAHRAIILVPSSLVTQLTEVEIPKYEESFNLHFDWCCIAGLTQHKRRSLMNKHRITIVPYSLLSTEDTFTLLEESNVDMIIADECQYLKVAKSSRTKRLLKYVDEFKPAFVCMSGTVIKRDLRDYWHLVSRCLGQLSPLPFDFYTITEMQEVVDPYNPYKGTLSPFFSKLFPNIRIAEKSNIVDVSKARKAIKTLFDGSPGTVRTENQSVDCSMQVNIIEVEQDPLIKKHVKMLEETWVTPFGDEIEDAIQFYAILSQILSGFYYRLYWPENTPIEVLAEFAKQNYLKKEIRGFLKYFRKGLDTPGLVMKALREGNPVVRGIQEHYDVVQDWNLRDRERATTHLSNYRVDAAKQWAKENKKGIIWYKWDATGPVLAKALPNATFCPANADISKLQKDGILICSFAHVEGKNMQQQSNNLLFNFPLSAAAFEQLMGRTHRQGQMEDCVYYDIIISCAKEKEQLRNVMKQANFLQDTDKEQKLLLADWVQPEYKKV